MRRLVLVVALCGAALLAAGGAHAEQVQEGDLRISFDGSFSPRALPRDRAVPISVSVEGSISTTDGSPPPRLQSISVAVNRHGLVSTRGLPVCPPQRLGQTSSATALSRCRAALVGHGRFDAAVEFPGSAPFPVEGEMLAFNSRVGGREAILMHIYSRRPIQETAVLVFRISRRARGRFGTVFSTTIPKIAAEAGYLTGISFSFGRRYRFQGAERSFLSASCPAPAGFNGGYFLFARGSFGFEGGQTLPIELTRSCRVRR